MRDIRSDWHFAVVTCLQRAVGEIDTPDPTQLASGVRLLAKRLPEPTNLAEKRALRDRLRTFTVSAGRAFHHTFHECIAPGACESAVVERADAEWIAASDVDADPRSLLIGWSKTFLRVFRGQHRWPAEVLAMMSLSREFRESVDLKQLAHRSGASRAALWRSFSARYGRSPATFQRQLRVLEAVRLLKETDFCVDAIAREIGYASTKNLYGLLRAEVGLPPAALRRMLTRSARCRRR